MRSNRCAACRCHCSQVPITTLAQIAPRPFQRAVVIFRVSHHIACNSHAPRYHTLVCRRGAARMPSSAALVAAGILYECCFTLNLQARGGAAGHSLPPSPAFAATIGRSPTPRLLRPVVAVSHCRKRHLSISSRVSVGNPSAEPLACCCAGGARLLREERRCCQWPVPAYYPRHPRPDPRGMPCCSGLSCCCEGFAAISDMRSSRSCGVLFVHLPPLPPPPAEVLHGKKLSACRFGSRTSCRQTTPPAPMAACPSTGTAFRSGASPGRCAPFKKLCTSRRVASSSLCSRQCRAAEQQAPRLALEVVTRCQ